MTEAPLERLLRGLILAEGPIGVDRYMALALGHPVHGYYRKQDPFGTAGDFTTAPEISQMFGEVLGLWCAAVYAQMGSPAAVGLVELGPGRGTLMADVLRAAAVAPAFRAALAVHLVETSPVLRARQAATLAGSGLTPTWHETLATVPAGPVLVLANEFFDALPVRHYARTDRGWCERLVGLDAEGRLGFGLSPAPEPALTLAAPPGSIVELGLQARRTMGELAIRIARDGGAALAIDYGAARPGFGATLQAVRKHRFVPPLEAPGEADLTAHVDFSSLRRAALAAGALAHGPVEQGAFLLALGIAARADRLIRNRPDQAESVTAALHRLTRPGTAAAPGMGTLFKVLAVVPPGAPAPPGFEPDPAQIEPASTM